MSTRTKNIQMCNQEETEIYYPITLTKNVTFDEEDNEDFKGKNASEVLHDLKKSIENIEMKLKYEIYGVRVDETNSNPETCCTYIEKAENVKVATNNSYGGWKDKYPFNKIKPCGFKNGAVYKYINPNDFTLYEDGTPVEDDVDVMIEFPKFYWKFTPIDNGYELRISGGKFDEDAVCLAHTIGTKEVDKIYIGAYCGEINEEKGILRSIRNASPTVQKFFTAYREYAQKNGAGYQQLNYTSVLMLQILYLIMYKNLNSQACLGVGYGHTDFTRKTYTGQTTDKKGMIFGDFEGLSQVKFLGVEGLYGNNLYQYVDGIIYSYKKRLLIGDNSVFNQSGEGYKDVLGVSTSTTVNGFVTSVYGDNYLGFIAEKGENGSSNTYYCDRGYLSMPPFGASTKIPRYGGGSTQGIFGLEFNEEFNYGNSSMCSRLVYI